jgi:hypothetical protein
MQNRARGVCYSTRTGLKQCNGTNAIGNDVCRRRLTAIKSNVCASVIIKGNTRNRKQEEQNAHREALAALKECRQVVWQCMCACVCASQDALQER